jgi:two-component system, OmpR family, KDP operon response regulator KdpE
MPHSSVPPKLLLVEDDEGGRTQFRALLERAGFRVAVSCDGGLALAAAERERPDGLILGPTLPGVRSQEICRRARVWYRGPILVLSGNPEESAVVAALDSGADDYVAKPIRRAELLARVRALLRRAGRKPGEDPIVRVGELEIDLPRRRAARNGRPIALTRTEFDILACLAANRDRVVAPRAILETVWGPHHGEYAQTLRVHVGHIRRKIGDDAGAQGYVVTHPGAGYRLTDPNGSVA